MFVKETFKRLSGNYNTQNTNNGQILYTSFNSCGTYLCFGLVKGFKIFSLKPFKLESHYFQMGGISIIEKCTDHPIVALVGGGENPAFQEKVVLWDYKDEKSVGEIKCTKPIKAVKIHEKL